jgi:hypothetical protein
MTGMPADGASVAPRRTSRTRSEAAVRSADACYAHVIDAMDLDDLPTLGVAPDALIPSGATGSSMTALRAALKSLLRACGSAQACAGWCHE